MFNKMDMNEYRDRERNADYAWNACYYTAERMFKDPTPDAVKTAQTCVRNLNIVLDNNDKEREEFYGRCMDTKSDQCYDYVNANKYFVTANQAYIHDGYKFCEKMCKTTYDDRLDELRRNEQTYKNAIDALHKQREQRDHRDHHDPRFDRELRPRH